MPIEKRGCRISVFEGFVDEFAGKDFECEIDYCDENKGKVSQPFNEMTTTDVCEILLKPMVAAKKNSYVDFSSRTKTIVLSPRSRYLFLTLGNTHLPVL